MLLKNKCTSSHIHILQLLLFKNHKEIRNRVFRKYYPISLVAQVYKFFSEESNGNERELEETVCTSIQYNA